jgi:hypothetical protein
MVGCFSLCGLWCRRLPPSHAHTYTQTSTPRPLRVVSFPSWELFERQSKEYKLSVFPDGVPVVSIEASVTHGERRSALSPYLCIPGASCYHRYDHHRRRHHHHHHHHHHHNRHHLTHAHTPQGGPSTPTRLWGSRGSAPRAHTTSAYIASFIHSFIHDIHMYRDTRAMPTRDILPQGLRADPPSLTHTHTHTRTCTRVSTTTGCTRSSG